MASSKHSSKSSNKDQSLVEFLQASWHEREKISWPTRAEVLNLTVVVIVSTIIVALYLGSVDYVLAQSVQALINLTRG